METVLLNELVALMWPVVAYFKCCTSYSGWKLKLSLVY